MGLLSILRNGFSLFPYALELLSIFDQIRFFGVSNDGIVHYIYRGKK